jgi:ubiquinone/menaquinone biosynthesis C-methylase UbiE
LDDAKARALKQEVREGWTQESTGWVKHADLIAAWSQDATALVVGASGARPGAKVLDLACGPGSVAFALAPKVQPGGSVTGCDLVPEMVRGAEDLARARGVKGVAFREADAEALPFPDASFDAVTCQHGVMFFPRAEQALREVRRVLKPGGRATLLAWGPPEGNPFLMSVMGPHLRRMKQPPGDDPDAPMPFRFAAPGSLSKVMKAAGFTNVREEARVVAWDFPGDPAAFWDAIHEITSAAFDWFRAELSPADLAAAGAEVQAAARAQYDGAKVRFTATMVLATGERMP